MKRIMRRFFRKPDFTMFQVFVVAAATGLLNAVSGLAASLLVALLYLVLLILGEFLQDDPSY